MTADHKQCLKEYEWGVVETSLANIATDYKDIKTGQKEILEQLGSMPATLKAQDKSIGRLWKVVFIALASAGAAIVTAFRGPP
ncbi:hypothetical protein LCGC14_2389260 [marine sediment metagenome]|uniref:Uncharacterized protein n=1 Tax=marine sediment metagenome TaxID=412755 RepID=A0A0F9CKS0_9ZZZZ